MSKKGFLTSGDLMEAVRALDYKAQYKVCEAFYKLSKGFDWSARLMFQRFEESLTLIDAENLEEHFVELHWAVNDMDSFLYENHYDFVNVHALRTNAELEKVFKDLGADDSHSVAVMGEHVYLPSPNLHALFLIRHMVSHFAAAEITLRQVLDWAFFVEKHGKDVDWEWLDEMLIKFHMKEFMSCINAICAGNLGFDVRLFPDVTFNPILNDMVLSDILDPALGTAEPRELLPRLVYKYKRWQGNAWKQQLCYSESRWESFWTGIWAKILKPASF